MHRLRRPAALLGEVKSFQHVEHFDEADASRGGRRRGIDIVAAVRPVDRLTLVGGVLRQVVFRYQALARFHLGDEQVGDRPLVESVRAAVGH